MKETYTRQELEIELLKQSNEKFTIFVEKYSEEEFKKQLEIELIKQKNDSFNQTLVRIESRMDWIVGMFIGMNALIITGLLTALGKAFNFF